MTYCCFSSFFLLISIACFRFDLLYWRSMQIVYGGVYRFHRCRAHSCNVPMLTACFYTVSQKTEQNYFCQNFVTQISTNGENFGIKCKMSAHHISLSSLPSLCQNFHSWWKFDKVLTKNKFAQFLFRHGVCNFPPTVGLGIVQTVTPVHWVK